MQFTCNVQCHKETHLQRKKNFKKQEIAILCLFCQTERRGKQKSRIVSDGNQRELILLFPSNKGPSYHQTYCRLHQF